MVKRFIDRIATPPPKGAQPRTIFLVFFIATAFFLAMDFVSWSRGGGVNARHLITSVGVLLLMLFFYSRQRQIRLVSFVGGAACLWFGILHDLHHFLVS
jgi:hypothetical protein